VARGVDPRGGGRELTTVGAPLGRQPGLDGLRAVAVSGVLLFHANVSWLPGGFLGVDVFFVLSGFLITRLLLDEHRRRGAISVGRFYVRRALRLLPALALMSAAVLVYAEVRVDPAQTSRAWHDALATATYHMNWRLALGSAPPFGFFDHAWSLGIEEQFYLAWPLVVVVVARRWGAQGVAVVAGVGALCSWAIRVSLVASDAAPQRVFYGLDAHADGLLLGASFAALTVLGTAGARTRRSRGLPGVVALAALPVAMATAHLHSELVERFGLVLVELAVVVVIHDVVSGGPTSRMLARRPLVTLGQVSYGAYLWHWPVYLAVNAGEVDVGATGLLAVRLAITAALTALSWVLVERPALRLKGRFESPRSVAVAAGRGREAPTT